MGPPDSAPGDRLVLSPRLPGSPGSVEAVYVEYRDPQHELEYYDISRDPFERDNVARRLTAAQKAELHRVLVNLRSCHSASACWAAGLPR